MALDIASSLNPASAIIGGVEGGFQFVNNLIKEKKDKAALASLETPFYKIQDEYYQNNNLAATAAQGGNPVAENDYLTSESQRGLGAAISGALQTGGSPADIGKYFDIYNRNIDKTYAESADQHLKNIRYFQETNKELAGQKTTQWAINKYQPYQAKLKQLSNNINSEEQNAYSGLNTAIGSVGALGTSLQNNKLLNDLFKTNSTPEPTAALPGVVRGNQTTSFNPPMQDPFQSIPMNDTNTGIDTSALDDFFNRQIKY